MKLVYGAWQINVEQTLLLVIAIEGGENHPLTIL